MASTVDRPVIMPLSNLTGTRGYRQPIPACERRQAAYTIAQANNALVFPGSASE